MGAGDDPIDSNWWLRIVPVSSGEGEATLFDLTLRTRDFIVRCNASLFTRFVVAAFAFVIAVMFSPGAEAQSSRPTPPPVFSTIDENSVDLVSGTISLAMQDVTIGQPGSGGLAFTRYWIGTGWRHNQVGTINSSGATYTVSIGASSETFALSGSTYTSNQAMGSTLTVASGIYTYTLRDGTVALFDTALAGGGGAFDANVARLTQITAPTGERETYTYNAVTGTYAALRLQSVTNNFGYHLHLDYARNSAPTSAGERTDWITLTGVTGINGAVDYCAPNANTCSYSVTWPSVTYALSGSYETITDAMGRATRLTYSGGVITAIRRPTSTSADNLTYTYTSGQVTSVSNGTNTWTYSYNPGAASQHDPLGQLRTVLMNAAGQISSITGPVSRTFQYDGNGRLTRITQSEGNFTQFTYDGRGNITATTETGKTGSGISVVNSASFPASCTNPVTCNQPTTTTDPSGNATNYSYDSTYGVVTDVTLPDPDGAGPLVRPQTRFGYTSLYAYYKNSGGSIVAAATPIYQVTSTSACATTSSCSGGGDETATSVTYGSTGVANNLLPTSTSAGAGNGSLTATTGLTYDNIGNLLTVDGPLSGSADTTRYRYDADRAIVGVVGPDPDGAGGRDYPATRITYNGDGQATMVEQGTVTSQSDGAWAAFSSLQQRNTSYNFFGLATLNTLTASGTTYSAVQMSYDVNNRLQCSAVRMNPSIFGSLPGSACDPGTEGANGPDRITRMTYNARDIVTQVTRGYLRDQINEWTITLTNNQLPATLTDAGGNVTTYEYDGIDRLVKIRFPNTSGGGSSTTDYEQYTWPTGTSRLTTDRRRDGTTLTYAYDNLNRVATITPSANGPTTTYTYDNFSRTLTAAASSRTLTYTYDQLSRVLSEAQPQGTMSYQWDLAGRRTRVTWPDALYAQYDYDLSNALTGISENGSTSLATYAYDNLGRRTGITRGNGTTESATFDPASRLTQLVQNLTGTGDDLTIDLTYDAAGGITSRTLSNSAYQWSPLSASATAYADNGLNQYTSIGGTSQAYDSRGNLTTGSYTYDIFNRLITGPSSATLAYDPAGRLYETVGGGTTTRFLYDGAQMVGEFNSGGTMQRRYIPGPALDQPVAWYEGANTSDRRWLAADERRSIVAVMNSSGAATTKNTYDEYGIRGGSNAGRFQYTGQTWLPDVSTYDYRARSYIANPGRFVQTDPILILGGINLYAYSGNDPVNFNDPFGTTTYPPTTENNAITVGLRCMTVRCSNLRQYLQDMIGGALTGARFGADGGGEEGGLVEIADPGTCPSGPVASGLYAAQSGFAKLTLGGIAIAGAGGGISVAGAPEVGGPVAGFGLLLTEASGAAGTAITYGLAAMGDPRSMIVALRHLPTFAFPGGPLLSDPAAAIIADQAQDSLGDVLMDAAGAPNCMEEGSGSGS